MRRVTSGIGGRYGRHALVVALVVATLCVAANLGDGHARAQPAMASVRVLHAAAGASDLDVSLEIGGALATGRIAYGELSPALAVPAGRVRARFSGGQSVGRSSPDLDIAVTNPAGVQVTFVLYRPGSIAIMVRPEQAADGERATIDLVNALDIGERWSAALSASGSGVASATYGGTERGTLAAGSYDLSVATVDAPTVTLATVGLEAEAGRTYLVVAAGRPADGIPARLLVLAEPGDRGGSALPGWTLMTVTSSSPAPIATPGIASSSPSPTPTPSPLASPTASPSPTPRPPALPGEVIVFETFADPATGVMPPTPTGPTSLVYGYADGEYFLRNLGPTQSVAVPGTEGDATIAADVRLVGDTSERTVSVGCRFRSSPLGNFGYRLRVEPSRGVYRLVREDGDRDRYLRSDRPSSAIRSGTASNRLEITCAGSTITAAINGTVVATVTDSTYKDGPAVIGVGARQPSLVTEARFDNLTVTRR